MCERPAGARSGQGSEPPRGENENLSLIGIFILDQTSGSLVPGGLLPAFFKPSVILEKKFPGIIQSPVHKV